MPEQVKKPEDPKLTPGRLQLSEGARNWWAATAETGHTIEQILNPAYWSIYANQLRPYDLVELRQDDGTMWALFLVTACERTWAKMHPLIVSNLTTQDVSMSQAQEQKFKYAYKGPIKQHCIIRLSDNAAIHEGAPSKLEALNWLRQYEKTIA